MQECQSPYSLGGHKVEAGHKEGGPRARGRPARPVVVGRSGRAAPVGVSVGVPIAVTPTVAVRAGAAPPVAVPDAGSKSNLILRSLDCTPLAGRDNCAEKFELWEIEHAHLDGLRLL